MNRYRVGRTANGGGGRLLAVPVLWALCQVAVPGCGDQVVVPDNPDGSDQVATYVGSAACRACHPNIAADHFQHAHSQALKTVTGTPPVYPAEAEFAGVDSPPPGHEWTDIAYVVGGYTKGANLVNLNGFVLTDADSGAVLSYHLRHLPSGTEPGYDPVAADRIGTMPFGYDCFRCHTTGPQSLDTNGGMRQGSRPGIGGTWAEDGVHCEVCHGPGSQHLPSPPANINPDPANDVCVRCHAGFAGPGVFEAAGGFIIGNQQADEVAASPHAAFDCVFCHAPHVSVTYDRENGLRNQCLDCHAGMSMALHAGKFLVQGDYVERLSCESCHMPLASKNTSSATDAFTAGRGGRIGDARTHIMYIDTRSVNYTALFTPGGQEVIRDAEGRAFVTLDYVCLRCHNGLGSAFAITVRAAAVVAEGIHNLP